MSTTSPRRTLSFRQRAYFVVPIIAIVLSQWDMSHDAWITVGSTFLVSIALLLFCEIANAVAAVAFDDWHQARLSPRNLLALWMLAAGMWVWLQTSRRSDSRRTLACLEDVFSYTPFTVEDLRWHYEECKAPPERDDY